MNSYNKYLKYKNKYIEYNNYQVGGNDIIKLSLKQPWFNYIKNGEKKIEGRLCKGLFKKLKIGDKVLWYNNNLKVMTKIIDIIKYKSFNELLVTEKLNNVLTNIKSIEEGVSIYNKFYSPEDEEKFGVIGIKLEVID